MRHLPPILMFLVLAACATPEQRCSQDATRDLRTLDALMVETRQNIDRGFAVREDIVPSAGFTYCLGNQRSSVGFSWCNTNTTRVRQTPVAIDVDEERRKLASMQKRRPEVAARAQAGLASCESRFPG